MRNFLLCNRRSVSAAKDKFRMFRMGFNILNWNHHPELSFLTVESYAGCIFYSSNTHHCVFPVVYISGLGMILLEKAMAPHSSTLAWKIPWMEEPVRLQSMGR